MVNKYVFNKNIGPLKSMTNSNNKYFYCHMCHEFDGQNFIVIRSCMEIKYLS